jgi:gas vesicle structural protein
MQPRRARRSREMQRREVLAQKQVSLCEVLDRVLNKGAVIVGDIVISVAGVELLYVGLNVLVSSVETMRLAKAGHHTAPENSAIEEASSSNELR